MVLVSLWLFHPMQPNREISGVNSIPRFYLNLLFGTFVLLVGLSARAQQPPSKPLDTTDLGIPTVKSLGAASWAKWNEQELPNSKLTPLSAKAQTYPLKTTPLRDVQAQKLTIRAPKAQKLESSYNPENLDLQLGRINSRSGLPDNEVSSICADSEDNLWLASENRVYRMSGHFIFDYNYRLGWPDMSTTDIAATAGSVFISTFGDGLFILKNNQLTQLSKSTGFVSDHLSKMVVWKDELLIATFDSGLVSVNGNHQKRYAIPFEDKGERIVHLNASEEGFCFMTNYGNVGMVMDEQLTMMRSPFGRKYFDFFTCSNGKFYAGTAEGKIIHWDQQALYELEIDGIESIQGMFLAPSGNLWVASENSLLKVTDNSLSRQFKNIRGLNDMSISEVLMDRNSNLWFASWNAGLMVVSPNNFIMDILPVGLRNPKARLLFTDNDQALILEHPEGGLVKRDTNGNFWELKHPEIRLVNGVTHIGESYYVTTLNGLFEFNSKQLNSIALRSKPGANSHMSSSRMGDKLLINSYNYGLILYDGNAFKRLDGTSSLTYASLVDEDGRIWVANRDKGLSIIDNGNISTYTLKSGFISNQASTIAGDMKGHVLIGTNRGLAVHDNGGFRQLALQSLDEGQAEIINSIDYNSSEDCFWVNSGEDLRRVTHRDDKWIVGPREASDFFLFGGLHRKAITCSEGYSYFLVEGNIVRYVPFVFDFEKTPQSIKFQEIRTDSSVLNLSAMNADSLGRLEILPDVQTIHFTFDVGAWSASGEVKYFYRILGISDQWIGPLSEQQISIPHPSSGIYTLEVKGVPQGKGVYNNANIEFSVTPRFYENPLYILLFLAMSLILVIVLIQIFSPVRFDLSESHTSLSAALNQIRILTIIAFLLLPVIAYFESVVLEAYEANWSIIMALEIVSVIAFVVSFHKDITYRFAQSLLGVLFPVFYSAYAYMAIKQGLPVSLSIEAACIIPFAKIIYRGLKGSLVFLMYALLLNALLIFVLDVPFDDNLTGYLSMSTQTSMLVVALIVTDGAGLSSLLFASKIVENAGLLIMVRERAGNIVFSNKYLRNAIEKKEGEVTGKRWWTLGLDAQHDASEWEERMSAAQNKPLQPRIERVTPNGIFRDVRWQEFVLDGEHLISIGRDITNELDLQKEVHKLSEVAVSASNGVARVQKDGTIIWNNSSFSALCGIAPENLVGQKVFDCIKVAASFKGSIEYGEGSGRLDKTIELPIINKDNSLVWVLATSTPVYDRDGQLEEIFEIWTDITEEKRLKEDYSYIINNASDIIYTTDVEGNFDYVNASVSELLELSPENLRGTHFTELVHPEERESVTEFYLKQLASKTDTSFLEFRILTEKGNTHWLQQSVKLITNPENPEEIRGIQAICRDVTQQKEFEERHSFIVSNATDGIYTVNFQGFFTYVNEAMRDILGYDLDEIIGQHFSKVVAPESSEAVIDFYARQLQQGVDETYHEFKVIDKQGVKKWVGQNVNAVADPKNPKHVLEFYSIVRDITERKQYERELSRLSLVAQKTNNVIVILDEVYNISWVNNAFTNVFGYSYDEAIGKNPGDLLNGPNTNMETVAGVAALLQKGERVNAEILNYSKDNRELWMEISMDPIADDNGQLQGFIAVEQEITERKRKEEVIRLQTKDIVDSIKYSKRIQEATITPKALIRDILPSSFVFYQPKDIVSGDFYLVDRLSEGPMAGWPLFLVADCTGHGVPGAMLSVLCSSILKQAFVNPELSKTSHILDYTRHRLASFFETSQDNDSELMDGMDIAICTIDEKNNQVHYSGANNPLWIVRDQKVIEFKGSRQHVGHTVEPEPFETQVIDLLEGDSLYIFSDGIIDQFGGGKGRRYMKRNLRKLILSLEDQTPEEREKTISEAFNDWRGLEEQTDDVCLMGISITQNSK